MKKLLLIAFLILGITSIGFYVGGGKWKNKK